MCLKLLPVQLVWRLDQEPPEIGADVTSAAIRQQTRTKIFLGYTSNLISAGVREHIKFLVKHRMVDVLVTSAGCIEEDFIKVGRKCQPLLGGPLHLIKQLSMRRLPAPEWNAKACH